MGDIDNDKDYLLKRWEQEDNEREHQREYKQSQRENYWKESNWTSMISNKHKKILVPFD